MPTYGSRPEDVVQDSRGNALKGLTVRLYANEGDALASRNSVGSSLTDASGRWSFEYAGGELWAKAGSTPPWRIDTVVEGPGGGGVTAHSELTGLDADDHPQYHTDARGDARYYTKSETNTMFGAITPPTWDTLAGKPATFPPDPHTHAASAVPFTPAGTVTSSTTQAAIEEVAAQVAAVDGGAVLVCRYSGGAYPALPGSKPASVQVVAFYGPVQPVSVPSWVGTGAAQALGEYTYADLS